MKLSPSWIRDFVDLSVDDRRLAEDLTSVGIAVEGISGAGADTVFEMEIGTNRPDAMNHYGVAREAAAIYDVELKPLEAVKDQRSAGPPAAKADSSLNSSGAAESRALSKHSWGGTTEVVPFPNTTFPITASAKAPISHIATSDITTPNTTLPNV